MVRAFRIQLLVVVVAVLAAAALVGCGGGDEEARGDAAWEDTYADEESLSSTRAQLAMDRPALMAPIDALKEIVVNEEAAAAPMPAPTMVPMQAAAPAPMPTAATGPAGMPGLPGNPGVPGAPALAPVATASQMPAPTANMAPTPAPAISSADVSGESGQTQAQLVTQRRIIIREVDIDLVVDDIQPTMDRIAEMAADAGGWVVDRGRSSLHSGRISFRVPSERLDATIVELRGIASKVRAELSTSRDVTDEYVDLGARLKNQQATESALLALLERAESVEAALAVQRDLTNVQEEIERISGRIKFLEETSAFSLIRVTLGLAPVAMEVDAGADQTVAARVPVRFRATFSPPDGIEDYVITWDFGDGSHPVTVDRTAPTQVAGQLITATVTHSYHDPTGSPFIAQLRITGTGEGGIVEGEDTLTVSVSEIPVIEVFAGDHKSIYENEEVEFSGSFTRPKGLTNVRYEWDFGDGSTPAEGELPEGVTRATATHEYPDYRREPYRARLTVTADSEVGEVAASAQIEVFVRSEPVEAGFVVAGFDFADEFKTTVRGLTGFVQWLSIVVMWLVLFSPIWGAVVFLAWYLLRKLNRRGAERRAQLAAAQQAPAQARSAEESG